MREIFYLYRNNLNDFPHDVRYNRSVLLYVSDSSSSLVFARFLPHSNYAFLRFLYGNKIFFRPQHFRCSKTFPPHCGGNTLCFLPFHYNSNRFSLRYFCYGNKFRCDYARSNKFFRLYHCHYHYNNIFLVLLQSLYFGHRNNKALFLPVCYDNSTFPFPY